MKLPFKDFKNEIKPLLSGFDTSIELENITSSLELGAQMLIDYISKDVYDLMIEHYYSDDYKNPSFENLNNLVLYCQHPISNLGMALNLPANAVKIGNDGITRIETTNQKTAYRYQVEDLKNSIINIGWNRLNRTIDFLQEKKELVRLWAPGIEVETDQKFYVDSKTKYYKANQDFTTSENFDDDIANWDLLDKELDIFLWQWIESEQYKVYNSGVFANEKDFGEHIGTQNEAAFYISCRYIIKNVIRLYLRPRFDTEALLQRILYNQTTDPDKELITNIKPFISKKTVAIAIREFDYYSLPANMRQRIANEFVGSSFQTTQEDIKKELSVEKQTDAEAELSILDIYLDSIKAKANNRKIEVPRSQSHSSKFFIS